MKKAVEPIRNKEFPAQSPSKLIYIRFEKAPIVGEEYYFDEDKVTEGHTIVGLKFHFFGAVFVPDLAQTVQLGAVKYNVAFYTEVRNVLLTIKNQRGEKMIDDQPCASLTNSNSATISLFKAAKYMRRFFLQNFSNKGSFVRFVEVPITPLPFVIPLQIFYR